MNGFRSERPKPWNHSESASGGSSSQSISNLEAPWSNFGMSVNAISFGFVATAILISMFLIMAIFEHLFRPRSSFPLSPTAPERSLESGPIRSQMHLLEKLGHPPTVVTSYSKDFSVVMPGQHNPTFIAQPAPLLPCQREGIYWPPHQQGPASA